MTISYCKLSPLTPRRSMKMKERKMFYSYGIILTTFANSFDFDFIRLVSLTLTSPHMPHFCSVNVNCIRIVSPKEIEIYKYLICIPHTPKTHTHPTPVENKKPNYLKDRIHPKTEFEPHAIFLILVSIKVAYLFNPVLSFYSRNHFLHTLFDPFLGMIFFAREPF